MLNVSKLHTELRKLADPDYSGFKGFPKSIPEARANWTQAYHAYASTAVDASNDMVATTNPAGFQSALVFTVPSEVPQGAQYFDMAFVAYWTGGVFAIGAPPVGAPCPSIGGTTMFSTEITSLVTTVVPNILAPLLAPIFANVDAKLAVSDRLQQIANAFHTATTTAVKVLITGLDTTPPPAGPLPITNLCGIR